MMLSRCNLLLYAVVFCILCSKVISGLNVTKVSKSRADSPPWWVNGVFYQIYPRSFKEEGCDKGIGNLKGITSKLDHLKELGITAILLTQIHKTSETENDDDIVDFKQIHSDYGTLDDFKALIEKAKKVDIKVILDFVLNHSGKSHPWFKSSTEGKNGKYGDFYVWHDGGGDEKLPPNNWLSVYGDSAWEWSKTRKQFYLHQFAIDQPDLNYAYSGVIEKMKGEMEFWLDKGIDGFRLNAIPYLFEDDRFLSEPRSNIPNVEDYEHQYLNHIYTMDQTKTYELIYKLRKFIDDYNTKNPDATPKILMADAYTSIENTIKYYGDKTNKGIHVPSNFQLIPHDKKSNAIKMVSSINEWLNKMPDGQIANWVVGNHDHHRAATRFGSQLANNINILIASLPGIMVTYNGEEIGQEDGEVTYVQCKDPIGCRNGAADFPTVSRDFERTPYHWDKTANAGFTCPATEPWLPVSIKRKDTNLQDQIGKPDSAFETYKDIVKLTRTLDKFMTGEVKVEADSEYVIKITRGSSEIDQGNYVVVINMGEQKEKLKVADGKKGLYYKLIYSTEYSKKDKYMWEKDVTIDAQKAIVLEVMSTVVTYDWWKHAVIYQIYIRSFKDEIKNDGIGDLQGVISKLEYLKGLGVNAICLSSVYKSSQKDLGYDVTDFDKIDELYGSMEDFNNLITFATYHGIKVIIDFVPNHSSINHRWFTEHSEYYVIDTKPNGPNNWLSIFQGKAWTGTSTSNEYYLHQFDPSQPDLNYKNDELIKEMEGTLEYWLDKGVSGFRMTAVPYLFENDDGFPDEPPSNHLPEDKDTWKSLKHIYTSNLQETYNLIYKWRNLLDIYTAKHGGNERILITDANTDIQNAMYYYGTEDNKGAHFTCNYQLMEGVDGSSNANDFAARINEWADLIPARFTSNWALGNHDKRRVATRFGPENVDGFNMLTAILPGVMVTYNGEEIGQQDTVLNVTDCVGDQIFCPSPSSPAAEIEKLSQLRRDRQRTPFHWDTSLNAGFTKREKGPWLPISPSYTEINVEVQTNRISSHYELYRRLLKLRQIPAFVSGSLKVKAVTDYVLTTLRYHTENESYFHLFNLRNGEETFNLTMAYSESTPVLEVVETNDHENLPAGTLLEAEEITLQGHQSIIARFKIPDSSAAIYAVSSFALLLGLLINVINFS